MWISIKSAVRSSIYHLLTPILPPHGTALSVAKAFIRNPEAKALRGQSDRVGPLQGDCRFAAVPVMWPIDQRLRGILRAKEHRDDKTEWT